VCYVCVIDSSGICLGSLGAAGDKQNSNPTPSFIADLDTSDLYIGIFWKGYGEYTIEEFEYASQHNIPRLIYQKNVDLTGPIRRDTQLQEFLDQISAVKSGTTHKWFTTPEELFNSTQEDVSGWVTDVIREKLAVHAPDVALQEPPHSKNFIGRKNDLDFFREKLAKNHFVIITGAPGIGKTFLGTKLARQVAESESDIFWFNFDPIHKTEADMLFWHFAEFFKKHGDQSFYSYLLGELRSKKPLLKSEKLALLLKSLEGGNYIICLDDFHQVKDVNDITDIFILLNSLYEGRQEEIPAQFIIMARSVPPVMQSVTYSPLEKFNEQETKKFALAHGLKLSPDLLKLLWQSTQGHPKFLDLSLSAIIKNGKNEQAMKDFIENMASQRDIQNYILSEIDRQITSPDERIVLAALTIFLSRVDFSTLEEILADKDIANVRRCVDALLNRNIINETIDGQIEIDSIVGEYFYQRELNREDRDNLHRRAANYFFSKKDYLATAHHFEKCRDTARSIEILTEHTQEIINTGRAGALLEPRIWDELKRKNDLTSDQEDDTHCYQRYSHCQRYPAAYL